MTRWSEQEFTANDLLDRQLIDSLPPPPTSPNPRLAAYSHPTARQAVRPAAARQPTANRTAALPPVPAPGAAGPYDLVRDTALASPAPANALEVLTEIGHKPRGSADEVRPRLATTDERRLLSLPQVSVVLELARTAHTADRAPVAVLHQIRRGDGASFCYEISYPGR